jgi:hypothetical protein
MLFSSILPQLLHRVGINCFIIIMHVRRCIQKFPDWLPGARTASGIALCHLLQLYRYFMSQSSEFCRHNPCLSTSNAKGKHIFRYDSVRKSVDTPSYVVTRPKVTQ